MAIRAPDGANNIFVNYPEIYIYKSFSVCGGQGVSLWRDKRGERNSGNLAKPFFDQLVILTYWQRQYETNTWKIIKWKY